MQPLFITKRLHGNNKEKSIENIKKEQEENNRRGNKYNHPVNLRLWEGEIYSNSFTSRLNPNGLINFNNEFQKSKNEYEPAFNEESEFLQLVTKVSNEEENIGNIDREELIKDLPPNFKIDFDDDSDQEGEPRNIQKKEEKNKRLINLSTKSIGFEFKMDDSENKIDVFPSENNVQSHPPQILYAQNPQFIYPNQQFQTQNHIFHPQKPIPFHYQQNNLRKIQKFGNPGNSRSSSNFNIFINNLTTPDEKLALKILRSISYYSKKKENDATPAQIFNLNTKDFTRILNFVKNYKNFGKKLTESLLKNYTRILEHSNKVLIKEKYDPNKKEKLIEEMLKDDQDDHYIHLNTHQLEQISHEDKDISSKFQVYLKNANSEEIEIIFQKMKNSFMN